MTIIQHLKKITKLGLLVASSSLLVTNIVYATSAYKGDELYQNQEFEQARIAYIEAAELGSPYVYYQLGTIYLKGQGTIPNKLGALLWFSLAAEYQFNDAENIVAQILKNIDPEKRDEVDQLVINFKKKYGKQEVEQKYLPEIISENLDKKITFGGIGKEDKQNSESDKLFGVVSTSTLSDDQFDEFSDLDDEDSFEDFESDDPFAEDEDSTEEGGALVQDEPLKKNPLDLPFLATIDYEVAPDGSIRNIDKVYAQGRAGNINTAMYEYSLLTLAKPTFDGIRVSFINRGHIGIHRYDLMQIRGKHKNIYDWVRRSIKKLNNDKTGPNNYKRAMFMLYFPWYPQEEGEALSLLKELAEQGDVAAQYEYGLYLYREQIDPALAIKWLSFASQYGLTKAQYRLGKIIEDSPWVKQDENKSLFWYEKAAEKAHPTALLKLAEMRLLAKDESLRDQAAAIEILNNIQKIQNKNPEYNYLVAVAHLNGDYRDFSKVVKHLRLAISQGNTLNWDVSRWEQQLSDWTRGNVTISEDHN